MAMVPTVMGLEHRYQPSFQLQRVCRSDSNRDRARRTGAKKKSRKSRRLESP